MAADTSGSGGFMFKHGEKLGLGVAGAVLVGFAAYAFGLSHDEEILNEANSALDQVDLKSNEYEVKKSGYEARADARATTQEWKDLTTASAMPAWAGNYPTAVTVNERDKPVTPTTTTSWLIADIKFTQTKVDLTGVTIEYEETTVVEDLAGTNQKKAAAVTGYELQRKTLSGPKAGDWETLETGAYEIGAATEGEGETARSFLRVKDPTIDPKTKYAYRIRIVGESKDARKDPVLSRFSNEKEVRTRGDFSWEPKTIVVLQDGRPQIGFWVTKFDRKYNKELLLRMNHFEGDMIGVEVKDDLTGETNSMFRPKDPKNPSKAALDENGKPIGPIDFRTGAVIKKVEIIVDRKLIKRVCDRVSEGGVLVCKGSRELEVPYSGKLVVITDDEGVDQDWYFPALPAIKDDVCEEHAKKPE